MKTSVALCTWNGSRFLAKQLDSLAGQTRLPDELVAFDDASTDSTFAVLEEFAAHAPFRVRLSRNTARLGVVANFEQAIAACTGDVIFLCDQDDEWEPEKIATLANLFEASDAGGIFTDAARIDESGHLLGSLWEHINFDGQSLDTLTDRNVATGATMAFRAIHRERILPIPREDGLLHDEWIALVLWASSKLMPYAGRLIQYREHAAQEAGAGKPAAGTVRWIEAAREMTRADYERKARRLELLADRVEARGLRERAAHLRLRAQLPRAKVARIAPVLRELPNYFRYSNHIWSIGRDLLLLE